MNTGGRQSNQCLTPLAPNPTHPPFFKINLAKFMKMINIGLFISEVMMGNEKKRHSALVFIIALFRVKSRYGITD